VLIYNRGALAYMKLLELKKGEFK